MILFNRVLPFLSALLIAITFVTWSVKPNFTYYIAFVICLINILSIWSLTGCRFFKKTFWNFLSTPFFFLASAYIFLLIIDNLVVAQIFIVSIGLVYMLILRNIFFFLHQTKDYQPYALENIYSYVNMISLFLFYAGFYGLFLFLSWPIWLFVILVLLLSSFLFMRTLWSYKINWQYGKLYIALIGIMMAEAFYAMSLLPTSYLFNSLIIIVIYYLSTNIIKDHLRQRLDRKNIKKYLLISVIITIISFLTTRWY